MVVHHDIHLEGWVSVTLLIMGLKDNNASRQLTPTIKLKSEKCWFGIHLHSDCVPIFLFEITLKLANSGLFLIQIYSASALMLLTILVSVNQMTEHI